MAAVRLTLWTAALTALLNAAAGTAVAYALARCEFPGRRIMNALVDLPLAVPALATGAALAALYGPWTIGNVRPLSTAPGIVLSLLFVSLPLGVSRSATRRPVEPLCSSALGCDGCDFAGSAGFPVTFSLDFAKARSWVFNTGPSFGQQAAAAIGRWMRDVSADRPGAWRGSADAGRVRVRVRGSGRVRLLPVRGSLPVER